MNPLVSVCVQTYNHQDYIAQCLDSILAQQTNFEFELIVGEDQSSDSTRSICQQYQTKYPEKIRLFLRSREDVIYLHGKATGRYNVLQNLKEAKGEYIALLEGDDYWTDPLKLQKQIDFMRANPDCSLSCHGQIKLQGREFIEDERTSKLENNTFYSANDLFAFRIQPQARTMMFRNLFTEDDLNGRFFKTAIYGDFAMCFLLSKYGKIGFLKEVMAVYRIHEQGYAARSLASDMDYCNSRFRLVAMWCAAARFLEPEGLSFTRGILRLYEQVIKRIGRKKALYKVLWHWNKMPVGLLLKIKISYRLKRRIIFNSK